MSNVPLPPELAARITAAEAALADFSRAAPTADLVELGTWAHRLAHELGHLLDGLGEAGPGIAHPGGGWISGSSGHS